MLLVIQISVVGDEHVVRYHPLYDRVAPFLDINDPSLIDLRADIVVPLCNKRKGGKHIQRRNCLRRLLDPHDLCGDRISHFTVQIILQRIELILRPKDHVLQLFELRRDIPLCIGKGLFAGVILWHEILV